MSEALESAQDYAQRYLLPIAVGSILAIPGAFLLLTGSTTLLPTEPCTSQSASTSTLLLDSTAAPSFCTAYDPFGFDLPPSRPNEGLVTGGVYRLIASTRNVLTATAIPSADRYRSGALNFASALPLSTLIIALLPGTFVFIVRQLPSSWASRHQAFLADILLSLALFFCADPELEQSDLLVLIFVMVAFDLFQQAVGERTFDAIAGRQLGQPRDQTSSAETPDMETCSNHTSASMAIVAAKEHLAHRSTTSDTTLTTFDAKDREIVRLQRSLTELKTAHRTTEVQLRVSKEELFNVRETLNGTFAEYANLREELKVLKQNLGRDHQAIVYRKDIELFALRKGNEQKDQCIRERDAKIEEMTRQHKAAIEVKDAQLRLMKERIISIERESSPRYTEEGEDGDHALEVRLLRVRKSSRTSQLGDEDKDATIARLREQLAAIPSISEDVVNHQAELSRAWDVAKKIKKSLKEECEKHVQTQEKLDEAKVKLFELEAQFGSRASTASGRLPTINENDHDKNELEAIFDTTQEDNLRLYAEVAALEKRLTDANSRTFAAVQESEALRSQLRMAKPTGSDIAARPSVVHHVHLQRMEDQLAELRDELRTKEEETRKLKKSLADKDSYIKEIQGELDAAATFHTQDQDEIERLKQSIAELQATKYQLMLDRERLVTNRPRHRVISNERTDRTSARSSGATLIQDMSAASNTTAENNAPVTTPQSVTAPEREGSIQQTPSRHLRSKSSHKAELNRWSLMSQNLPPPELREYKETRRKSSGFKEVMQKMVGGNKKDDGLIRRALTPKDKNTRPSTAASTVAAKPVRRPSTKNVATSPLPQNVRAPKEMRKRPTTQRYYAEQETNNQENQDPERPRTMGANVSEKPKSRLNWTATNKLKRRSLL